MFKNIMPSAALPAEPKEAAADGATQAAAPTGAQAPAAVETPAPTAMTTPDVPSPGPEEDFVAVPPSPPEPQEDFMAAPAAPAVEEPRDEDWQAKPLKKDRKEPALVNLFACLLEEKLDAAIAKFHCCTCEKCRKDVEAITLNKIRPRYEVLTEDFRSDMLDPKASAELTTALVQAILVVKSKPRHNL